MDRVLSELKVVFRQLRKASGFTATAVLMLAFGIGATTAIFSIVYGVLLRPLTFPEANRLVTLGDQVSGTDWGQHDPGPVTGPEVVTYTRDTHAFSGLGGFGLVTVELSGIGEPAQVIGTRMSPALFPTLGVAPLMGRVFTEQEDQRKEPVAVLSYSTWKSRFQGDPHVVGTKVLIDRKPVVIIGVMPRSFEFPLYPGRRFQSELWMPIRLNPQELSPAAAASWYLQMVGRLKPGVTPAQAQSDAAGVAQQIMRNFPPDAANFRIRPVVYPLQEIAVADARPLLRMLFLAIAVVLLIACANLAGLMLVRAIHHQHETAVRLAIGASTFTLLRTSVLEGLVLSIGGGLLGIGLAALALALGKSLLPETLPRLNDITLNWPVVGFALLLAVLRSLRDVALTLAPILFTGLLTLATCVVIGQPLNFANIIAFPLLLGIGVAFNIYFVIAWRNGETNLLRSSLARAVLFSALTTGASVGSLILSPHPGTSGIGELLMIARGWTLVTALLFEPALLGPPPKRT